MTLRDQLLEHEGVRLKVYRCPSGKLSIGVGRNLEERGITREEAMILFDHDIFFFSGAVLARWPWARTLNEPRFAVLVNMAFNLGIGGLARFPRMLDAAAAGRWEAAAREILDSDYAGQVKERARQLAAQLETGEWQ